MTYNDVVNFDAMHWCYQDIFTDMLLSHFFSQIRLNLNLFKNSD